VAIFFSPSPQGDEDEELYEKNAEMKEVDGVIISSIHRITGNEYFKQLFLRQSQNCFSARSAKEPSTQKSRLWDFLPKMGRFSPLHYPSPQIKKFELVHIFFQSNTQQAVIVSERFGIYRLLGVLTEVKISSVYFGKVS
jgi:hypothetical protein